MGATIGGLRLIGCLFGLASCSPTGAQPTIEPDVAAIISRTRETQSTYAVYAWNEVTPKGKAPFAEWSAEFHSGNLHRVENPKIRMIADCKGLSGTFVDIGTGKRIEGPQVAKMACGIQANAKIVSARKLGTRKTPFGLATMIEVEDASERRTYDISEDGILLGQTIGEIGKGGHGWVVNYATHVSRKLPEDDIFSEQSLNRSVVAAQFRQSVVNNAKGD